jgi:sec-independent protein translocase protein TatA
VVAALYDEYMPNIGPLELVILLVIVLVIFGPKRLPGLGRSLGSGMREFKDSITGESKQPAQPTLNQAAQPPAAPPPPAAAAPAPAPPAAAQTPPAAPEQAQVPAEPTHQA